MFMCRVTEVQVGTWIRQFDGHMQEVTRISRHHRRERLEAMISYDVATKVLIEEKSPRVAKANARAPKYEIP